MHKIIDQAKKYLEETLSITLDVKVKNETKNLPVYLNQSYAFFETNILSTPCVLLLPKAPTSPHNLQKHSELISKYLNSLCVFIFYSLSHYERNRLIHHRIPFIVPGNQTYLPDLGIDLREHFIQHRIIKHHFSPSTQAVIISILTGKRREKFTPSELALDLNYSPMTMTRAFNEIETAGLGLMTVKGRERIWTYEGSKIDLWNQTKDGLRSPVQSCKYMKIWPTYDMPQLPLAGISALAEKSMIAHPRVPTYAIGVENYSDIKNNKGFYLSPIEEADFELEIWHYDPKPFIKNGTVDTFSLYLSLRNEKNERTEMALEELLENEKW